MTVVILIVAAGRGSRAARSAGSGGLPKQYICVAGTSVIARSIQAFARHMPDAPIQVVIHPDDVRLYEAALGELAASVMPPVFGGATRQESVRRGLEALEPSAPGIVLIHDAARPFVTAAIIDRVLNSLAAGPAAPAGAIAAIASADSLKRADAAGRITGSVDRAGLWRAQTPQGFAFGPILAAHRSAQAAGRTDFTDDAALAEWAGLDVAVVEGGEGNVKLTTVEDIEMAEKLLAQACPIAPALEVRTGSGFDVHRFTEGDGVWLCGVKIPHTAGLDGHSDADVALHALTDALLGAIADGDIGQHFPPSDPQWKGAASHIFLAHAGHLIARRGGRITHVDVTILAEAPKIAPHCLALRRRVADILDLDVGRVSVKATTTERLGFTGRREGIAAMATATVLLPTP